ncbi:hypothetical protein BASA84_001421 [Batrachochytrium salamandrivorans]|nr:hypothetical protein BASA84_001421 [Batrachochytrium salamandrivorans]
MLPASVVQRHPLTGPSKTVRDTMCILVDYDSIVKTITAIGSGFSGAIRTSLLVVRQGEQKIRNYQHRRIKTLIMTWSPSLPPFPKLLFWKFPACSVKPYWYNIMHNVGDVEQIYCSGRSICNSGWRSYAIEPGIKYTVSNCPSGFITDGSGDDVITPVTFQQSIPLVKMQ